MMLYLTPSDNVAFITDQQESLSYKPYYNFLESINTLRINYFPQLVEDINRFQTIWIDFETGDWKVYEQEKVTATFDELFQHNKRMEKKANKQEDKVKIAQKWIADFVHKHQKIPGLNINKTNTNN